MDRKIVWTSSAENDRQKIYDFNSHIVGELKAFQIIEKIVLKTDILNNEILSGTRYISNLKPETNYQKLSFDHLSGRRESDLHK